MSRQRFYYGCVVFLALAPAQAMAGSSGLWGEQGEQWDPRGRVPDFSYAGYRAGREPVPDVPVATNVVDFGAVGDGTTDDTAAFTAAIAATEGGAVLVPAGRYRIRDILTIDRDDVVLRGEGPDASVLFIDRSLTDLNDGVQEASFSWSGGLIVLSGSSSSTSVGPVVAAAARGDRWLELETTAGIEAGSLVSIALTDDGGSLGRHMHNDQADAARCSGEVYFNWRTRVAAVDAALQRIELDEPLPVDVRLQWDPEVEVLDALMSGSGIENLGIEFPSTPYPGHLEEQGYNAIRLSGVADVWVRDVDITNADSGIFVGGPHVTIENVGFYSERPRDGSGFQGHHGIIANQTGLYTGLTFQADYIHSVTVTHQSTRNVFAEIGGPSTITLDHHRRSPLENLFTAFTADSSYRSGGNACEGPHAGARHTYWGLAGPIGAPCNSAGSGECWGHIQSTVVGELSMSDSLTDDRQWYESVADLEPRNLYEAQLERRLAIEDRTARFSPLRFGVRSEWEEHDRFRWAVVERDGDDRYALMTTVHESKEGDRLGEYTLADTPPLGDVTITARVASAEPLDATYPDVCVVLGHQDDDNYVYAMFNGDAESSALFVVQDGQRQEVANAGHAVLTDRQWHTIEVRRTGERIEMVWDGETIVGTDVPLPIPGRVGVGTYNDVAYFDDIEIESPDLPEEPSDGTGSTTDGGNGSAGDDDGSSGTGGTATGAGGSTTSSLPGGSGGSRDGGCSCRTSAPPSRGALLFLLAWFSVLSREARRSRRRCR